MALSQITLNDGNFKNVDHIRIGTVSASLTSSVYNYVNLPLGGIPGGADDEYFLLYDGLYLVTVTVVFDPNPTGMRVAAIERNRFYDTIVHGSTRISACSNGNTAFNIASCFPAEAGEIISVRLAQNSGATLNANVEYRAYLIG